MGLKYEIFMIKGTSDELYKKMFNAWGDRLIDTSEMSRKEREYYQRPIKIEGDIKKFMADLEPDPELVQFIKDQETWYNIWWMDHPTQKGFVVGGYTNHWMQEKEFTAIFAGLIATAGIDEFIRVSFHHGSNDGNIYKLHIADPMSVENYEHQKGEEEKWEIYVERVNETCGYPVLAWHNYIDDPDINFIPWEHTIRIKKKSEMGVIE
jgi:hypothetical protein